MKKRNRMRQVLFVMVMLIFVPGCLGKRETADGQARKTALTEEANEFAFLEEEERVWKDNSLDDWQAVINLPVNESRADGDLAGGWASFMVNEAGCAFVRNHLTSYYKNDWSGASVITRVGEEASKRIEVCSDWEGLQISRLGPVSGGDGYVGCKDLYEDQEVIGRWLFELDGNFETVQMTQLPSGSYKSLEGLMGDGRGNYHLTYFEGLQRKYVVISPEGETIFEAAGSFEAKPLALGGGRVVICKLEKEGSKVLGRTFCEADPERGELREVGILKEDVVRKETREKGADFAIMMDESRLLFFGQEGAYICNERGEEARIIYRWASHGMVRVQARDACVMNDGTIGMVCEDGDGLSYLVLRPTPEKMSVKTITMAVSPSNAADYLNAAAYFNKKYPTYQVQVRDDYDEMSLLTQLGAGDGPVLIDSGLTGFEELERLWQPLDGFLEASGIGEELIPEAREFGKIGNVTYGIVTSFWIRTALTADECLTDWNYGGYLSYLESHPSAAPFSSRYVEGTADWRSSFFYFLENGLEDNYYLDMENGSSVFGTKEFDRVTKLMERAGKCPASGEGKAISEGVAACELYDLYGIENVIELRMRLERNNEKVLGCPTKDGARHFLFASDPIVIRSTATDEEKKMAYTFLQILLSKEVLTTAIKGKSYGLFSVRRDVLDAQFKEYEDIASLLGLETLPKLDEAKDKKLLMDLLKNAVPKRTYPVALKQVMDEELSTYLKGGIDEEALSEHLKSRTWLFLEEQK